MKKIGVLVGAIIALASCGSSDNKNSSTLENPPAANETTVTQTKDTITTTPDSLTAENKPTTAVSKDDQKKGLALISKSDCVSCHHVTEKLVGPSYAAVAKRYEGKAGAE